jgi:hypothetical protein
MRTGEKKHIFWSYSQQEEKLFADIENPMETLKRHLLVLYLKKKRRSISSWNLKFIFP